MPLSMTLLPYLQLTRAPAVFTAMSNILAAHLVVSGGRIQWTSLLLLMAASSCLYLAGMVLNDCFDVREDARDRPGRPLPSGRVTLTTGWSLGWSLLASGVGLAALVGTVQLWIAVALATAIVIYNGVLKATVLGSLVMGLCRYLNWLLGLSVYPLTVDAWLLALPIGIYVTSLTVLSRQETETNDRRLVLLAGSGLVVTAGLILALHLRNVLPHAWALLVLLAGLLAVLRRLSRTFRDFRPQSVQATVKLLILGIIPLDAILAFAGAPWWSGLVVLSLLIPARAMARVIYVT